MPDLQNRDMSLPLPVRLCFLIILLRGDGRSCGELLDLEEESGAEAAEALGVFLGRRVGEGEGLFGWF